MCFSAAGGTGRVSVSDISMDKPSAEASLAGIAPQLVRAGIGGVLMGLANLVPGISGGTMLLASGIYRQFIESVAEVTTLRFQVRSLATLGCVGGAAAIAILSLAGWMKGLVVDHRWVMFSLFIGLTLGGVPVIWRLLRPLSRRAAAGCLGGLVVMIVVAFVQPGAATASLTGPAGYLLLFVSGVAAASAMILPGISGGYLLLVLGQYLTILGAIDELKTAVVAAGSAGFDWNELVTPLYVFVPLGIGVVVGVVGISNLIKTLLARYEKPTLGVLLGLLIGAVFGLWPFQEGVAPEVGDVVAGRVMTRDLIAQLPAEKYLLEGFSPSGEQIAGAAGLILAGFLVTQGIALIGRSGGSYAAGSYSSR